MEQSEVCPYRLEDPKALAVDTPPRSASEFSRRIPRKFRNSMVFRNWSVSTAEVHVSEYTFGASGLQQHVI